MEKEINYQNNPLHGVGLKSMLDELVEHYGFEILFAYLNINCFKTNPSIASSIKFLKKTDWAREKVEVFYLYKFKNLPDALSDQFSISPRDRIIPEDQKPGEPAALSFEDAERLLEEREKKMAANERGGGPRSSKGYVPPARSAGRNKSRTQPKESGPSIPASDVSDNKVDPWANSKNRSKNRSE